MAVIANVVQGQTSRLTWAIQADGAAFDGTGLTLSDLVITGADGIAIDTTGNFGWVSAAAGTVYYDPDASDFTAAQSPYRVHVHITDGSGKILKVPNNKGDEINCWPD